ncbi:MAG TPA: MotA/TolQ/ExbB proton channel family protein [Verrucomicrobiae bacterium]|nr:MotA/TolQ/ExbB proton channel family protein [Verrucomicrobiae bacterium]
MEMLIYILLGLTSVVGVTFVVERAWSLRWNRVVPPAITAALGTCKTSDDLVKLCAVCKRHPSPLGRLLLLGATHLDWPKSDNVDTMQSAARHEIVRLERGLVVLEVIVGIAPLLGLVGTIVGMISVFSDIGQTGLTDANKLAHGISVILQATLAGLLIAIPSLIAWSYFSKKVEVLAVEMEALCDEFIRRMYSGLASGALDLRSEPPSPAVVPEPQITPDPEPTAPPPPVSEPERRPLSRTKRPATGK